MENMVGLRLRPTDEEILDDYLGPKNLKSNTSHVDGVISTVSICSFDPLELPPQSRIKLKDHVWYFFSPKENKYGKGERQIRTTKSGYWKITGKPKDIIRNCQKIGHKRFLMFYFGKTPNGSKYDWVMHEYHLLSPTQMMMTYTFCKVKFKGNMSEIEQSRSLITPMNNLGGLSTRTEVCVHVKILSFLFFLFLRDRRLNGSLAKNYRINLESNTEVHVWIVRIPE